MKAAFYTLGCKVNQYDTDSMREVLRQEGYQVVDFEDFADVYIINSCTVTGTGDKKSRQMIHRARSKNPKAIICMAGCYSQTASEQVAKLDVDLILGTGGRQRLPELLLEAREKQVNAVEQDLTYFEELSSGDQKERTRAYLKVQDGCDRFCTYCIIPYARGKSRSRKTADVLKEALRLVSEGYKEIVVTGIHVASFGKDTKESLLELLQKLDEIDGLYRIRLSSLEPLILTEKFVQGLKSVTKLCPSFHISLQSGCNATLKRMGRRYTTQEYYQNITRLRESFPLCAVTTDVIVGFPGETEEEFSESLSFVEQCNFAKVHLFPYSARTGTPAAKMSAQVKKSEKAERLKRLKEITSAQERAYHRQFLGKNLEVLWEIEVEKNRFSGYTSNYIRTTVTGSGLHNVITNCKMTGIVEDGLSGEGAIL